MPGIDFAALRRRVPLARVLELAGFEPWLRHGAQVRGPCPVHRSRSPRGRSFAAHLGRGCWQCFACGAHGNALDLWAAVSGLPLYAAALDLCARLALEVPRLPVRRRPP